MNRYIKETFELGGNKTSILLPKECGFEPHDEIEVSKETVIVIRKVCKNEKQMNTKSKKFKKILDIGSSAVHLPVGFGFEGKVLIEGTNGLAIIRKV